MGHSPPSIIHNATIILHLLRTRNCPSSPLSSSWLQHFLLSLSLTQLVVSVKVKVAPYYMIAVHPPMANTINHSQCHIRFSSRLIKVAPRCCGKTTLNINHMHTAINMECFLLSICRLFRVCFWSSWCLFLSSLCLFGLLVNARNAAASYIPAIKSLAPNQMNYAPTPAKYTAI